MEQRNKKKQKGSALVWVVSLFFIFMMTALVVDAGRLHFEKKQLQTAANTVASQLAGEGQTCFGSELATDAIDLSASAAAIVTNKFSGYSVGMAKAVFIDADNNKLSATEIDDARESNGVAVTLTKPVTGLLAFAIDDDLSAHALAKKELIATINASSSTANVSGGVLGGLLGLLLEGDEGAYNLDVTQIESLTNTTFKLGGLLDELGVSTLDDVVPADDLVRGVVALTEGLNPAVEELDAGLGNLVGTNLKLSDIIKTVNTEQVPKSARFPVYDTVTAVAMNALTELTDKPIDLGITLPGLSGDDLVDTDLTLKINQGPTIAVGPARMDATGDWVTQFDFSDVELTLNNTLNVGGLLEIQTKVSVDTGGGVGSLVSADCATGSNNEAVFGVDVDSTAVNADIDFNVKTVPINLLAAEIKAEVANPEGLIKATIGSSNNDSLLIPNVGKGDEPLYLDDITPVERSVPTGLNNIDIETIPNLDITITCDGTIPIIGEIACGVTNLLGSLLSALGGIVGEVTNFLQLGNLLGGLLQPLVEGTLSAVDEILRGLGVAVGDSTVVISDASQGGLQVIECSKALCKE